MGEPLCRSPDDLYQQFKEIKNGTNIDNLAHEFECLTNAHLKVLTNLRNRRSLTVDDYNICQKLEVMLREESFTWRLIKALYKDGQETDQDEHMVVMSPGFSEEQIVANYYIMNSEIRRMQVVIDWLEANEATDSDYKDEEDKVEFYTEGPTAWENTFYAMRANYNINIPILDVTLNPNAGLEICPAMDPDAPIRTKKSLVHSDKEVEIRLFKHLFRFIRAGKLEEAQELAQRVGYHWLAGMLDGWLPFSDPNLDDENLGVAAIHQPSDLRPTSGNKKRHIWKQTCYKTSKIHGLISSEKAILGVLGGNLKSVLPVCNNWSDQLWARLRCSIDVKIETVLRDLNIIPQEHRSQTDFPKEFYASYQDLPGIFNSIKEMKLVSPYKEATIHQSIQKHFILNDIEGLLSQLQTWCASLEYDNNLAENDEAISPQFLRLFAHIVVFLRETNLVTADDERGNNVIESYISFLTQQKSIESVAYYTVLLPEDKQVVSYAKLLSTIDDREERRDCLSIAGESNLDVNEITQTVVEMIRNEPMDNVEDAKTTASDQRKIDSLDYLLYLGNKNYVAILHQGNALLRAFALCKKLEAVKDTYLKLPANLGKLAEEQWKIRTNAEISPRLWNNLRELEGFRVLLEAQEELAQWSAWHHKKPDEPKKPVRTVKFCDNVNYEQRLRQYQQDMSVWVELRKTRTNSLTTKITELFYFQGGWMTDIPTNDNEKSNDDQRIFQLGNLRKIFIPQMTSICFNVLHLTERYEDCLTISHLLASDELKLYEEFTKPQLRDFLDKISDVAKTIVKKSLTES